MLQNEKFASTRQASDAGSGDTEPGTLDSPLNPSEFFADVESHRLSLRGHKLTAAIAFVTGTGFTLFG